MLYIVCGAIIIGIIIVSSVFVIRNSFSISVSEKTKQYGMMASIGATGKQIRKSVLFEGLIIGLIGVPAGILIGSIAIAVLVWLLNILLEDMLEGMKFIYGLPYQVVLLATAMSAITIYLSCIIPARRAAKISPIEAIRGNNDIKVKSKKLKTSKLTKKIFGIGGVIASKNLKRSKKKYRTTVISLVVSISIFIALSSFLGYGKKITGIYYTDLDYNVILRVNGEAEDKEKLALYKEIIKENDIKEYSYSYQISENVDVNKYGTDYGKRMAISLEEIEKENSKIVEESNNSKKILSIQIVSIEKNAFAKYAKKVGISKDYDNVAILVDDMIEYNEDGSRNIKNMYNIKEGENITFTREGKEESIKVSKRTDIRPMGYENNYSNGGYLFISEESNILKDGKGYLSSLTINSEKPTELETKLNDLKRENEKYSEITVSNLESYKQQEEKMILVISIFLYGFTIAITLIGVTNIFNTITTNMILRSKEFAMLKSVGMTTKEFNRMIKLESILYGLKSLIIGIPIGTLLSYAIYKATSIDTDFGYTLPWQAIIISFVFVFIIVGLTMKYSLNKINKQNIVETIRNDNI